MSAAKPMSEAKLNWASARVQDGELAVELEGGIEKGWKRTFETTVKLLGSGEWGKVAIKKGKIRVTDVVPGNEEKLRHYLESVVEQANVSESADQEKPEAKDESDDTPSGDGPDAQMTQQFRAFAEQQEEEES